MTYRSREELPPSIRGRLPWHAQDVFVAAYNEAYEEFEQDDHQAAAVAWGVVVWGMAHGEYQPGGWPLSH